MLRAWKQPAFKLDFRRKQIAESKVAMFVTFLRVGVEDERTAVSAQILGELDCGLRR